MPTLTITKSYSDGNVLNESDLDNIRDDITTFLNTTKIDGDNIQTAAITAGLVATGAIDTNKLAAAAVETNKIADNAVLAAKLGTDIGNWDQVVLGMQIYS